MSQCLGCPQLLSAKRRPCRVKWARGWGVPRQGKWPVMCQGVHDGVTPSGQEACGVSSGRGTRCAEGAWLGCHQQGKFILFLIAQKAKLDRTTARGS